MIEGRIQKALSGFYYVDTGSEVLTCRARGKFRKDGVSPLVGDRVEVRELGNGEGFVERICPRKNAFARPAVAQMVRGFTDHPFPYEPIFTHVDASALLPLADNQDTEVVTLAGNLCTSADIIAKDVSLPRMEIGDGLALDNAGCYAAVMTPMQFAFMAQPAQLFLTRDGRVLKA